MIDITSFPYSAVSGVDATSAIQAAIDDAEAAGGGTVFIPSGFWPISYLTIDESNVSLIGEGDCSNIHVPEWGVGGGAHILAGSTSKDLAGIHFRNFKMTGTHPVTDRDWFTGTAPYYPKNAIQFGTSSALYAVSDSGVRDSSFEKVGGNAIGYTGGQGSPSLSPHDWNVYAVNNRISNSVWGGINAHSGSPRNALVQGNQIRNVSGVGIQWSGMSVLVTGNIIEGTENSGLHTAGRSDRDHYQVVVGNVFSYCGLNPATNLRGPAVQIGDATVNNFVRFIGNTIRNSYGQGVVITSAAEDIDISGNLIDGFGIDGIGASLGTPGNWAGISAQNGKRINVTGNLVIAAEGENDRSDYGILTGGSASQDTWTDGNRTRGNFRVKSYIQNSSAGRSGIGTRNRVGRNIDLTTGKVAGLFNNANIEEIPLTFSGDSTPSVLGYDVWRVSDSTPNTITDLDDGYKGQTVTLMFLNSNATIDFSGTNLKGNGGVDWTPIADESMSCTFDGSRWYCRV